MVWGILGALNEEIELLKNKMDVTECVEQFGTHFYKGFIGKNEVILVCCGIGKVNAAICASVVIREFNADIIVNVGIAGAMDKRLKIFDIVISEDVCFHDQDDVMVKYYPNRAIFNADRKLIELCELACSGINKSYTGRIATGDVFVNDKVTKERIIDKLHPLCVEMEGAAIAHAAFMNNTPFIIIRSMSDNADDSADNAYDNFITDAANQSAKIILKMLELYEK